MRVASEVTLISIIPNLTKMNFFSAGPGPVRPSIHPGAAQQRRLQQLHRSAQVIVDQVFIVIIITLYLHLKSIYYYYICNCSLIETSL